MTFRSLAVFLVVSVFPRVDASAQPADPSQPAEPLAPAVSQEPAVEAPVAEPSADEVVATKKKKKKKKKSDKRLNISGYVQVFYRYAFETGEDGIVDNDHFRVLRARLKFKGKIAPKVRYVVEVDPRAPEVTGIMRDAYLSLGYIPRHEVRVGQQKTLFGYENTESSTRLFAVNRSEYADSLSRGVNLRDIGLGILGSWPLTETLRVEDAFNVVNGNGANTQADDTDRMSVWGRVGLRYKANDLRVWGGVSFGRGDFIEAADLTVDPPEAAFLIRFLRFGADLRVDHPWFFAAAEGAFGVDEEMGEENDVYAGYLNVVGKTKWNAGPTARVDIFTDEFQRITLGGYYGASNARLRYMVNYELRQKLNDERGDDKLYFWVQGRF